MTDLYDDWLRFDKWNTKQAAFIFNGKDPSLNGDEVKFPDEIEDNYKLNKKEWQRKVCLYYHTFEVAEWRKYIDESLDPYLYFRHPKEASPCYFFSIAKDKQLELPPELLEKWEKSNSLSEHPKKASTTNASENNLSEAFSASPPKKKGKKTRITLWRETVKAVYLELEQENGEFPNINTLTSRLKRTAGSGDPVIQRIDREDDINFLCYESKTGQRTVHRKTVQNYLGQLKSGSIKINPD